MIDDNQDMAPVTEPVSGTDVQGSTDRRKTVIIVLAVVLVLAILAAAIYGMAANPDITSVIRDIAIIALALVTLIIGLFLIVLIFQLQSLIVLLRDEIKPILDSANQTANTVRGTTTFVSDAVVTPMIQVASIISGVGQTFKTLAGTGHKRKGRKKTPANSAGE
jgi:hypothetical protein